MMTNIYQSFRNERAVSPVIGVMLMLVVVIIIAAVVSGFAGGMIGTNNQKAPSLTMDAKMINMGSWVGSGFFATVTSVSEPIPTKDLKIVTSWSAKYDDAGGTSVLKRYEITGGNTTLPGVQNINYLANPETPLGNGLYVAPFGFGSGINGSTQGWSSNDANLTFSGSGQQFGNYTLMPGTALSAQPCGAFSTDNIGGTWVSGSNPSATYGYGVVNTYSYNVPSGTTNYLDPISALLGANWQYLRVGDKVNVKIIHIPTGKVIYQQDIPVTEG